MTATDLLRWGIEATLATGMAVLVVWLLRRPLRRAVGARIAYFAWALVPLSLLAVSLPGPLRATLLSQAMVDAPRRLVAAVTVGAAHPLGDPAAMQSIDPASPFAWLLAWALGMAVVALAFAAQQRRFVASLGGTAVDDAHPGMLRARRGEGCPAVLGAWRPRIVLPPDFELRWPDVQAILVLAHEREHIARGDTRANFIVALLRCVFWFNPLLHAAARRFRYDQELACDAAVLARHPNARRAYADAMLKTQLAVPGLPVGCHWQSSQSLKERILMLKSPLPGAWRHRAGVLAVATILSAASYAAWALQAPPHAAALEFHGSVNDRAVAVLTLPKPDLEALQLHGPSMGDSANGNGMFVLLDRDVPLTITHSIAPRWSLVVWGDGSMNNPAVRWELTGDGIDPRAGTQTVGRVASTLVIDAVTAVLPIPVLTVAPLPEDRIYPRMTKRLTPDRAGTWRADPVLTYSDLYGGNGDAMLVAELDAAGRVREVQIESASHAKLLTPVQANELLSRNVYAMAGGQTSGTDGRRVRVPVSVWRDQVRPGKPVVVTTATTTAQAATLDVSTPAPPYPPGALAERIGGHVLLHLLVAADGSVKDAKVVISEPVGVFDAASIEAAKRWTLRPEMRDGKPVEGWMQVPITFDPERAPDPPPAGATSG